MEVLNVFQIPVQDAVKADEFINSINLIKDTSTLEDFQTFLCDHYNYKKATSIVSCFWNQCTKKCDPPEENGPYLVTLTDPLDCSSGAIEEYLVLDLSHVPSDAFPEFIWAYKEQVKRKDFSDEQELKSFRLFMLEFVVKLAKSYPKIKEAVKDIIQSPEETAKTPS